MRTLPPLVRSYLSLATDRTPASRAVHHQRPGRRRGRGAPPQQSSVQGATAGGERSARDAHAPPCPAPAGQEFRAPTLAGISAPMRRCAPADAGEAGRARRARPKRPIYKRAPGPVRFSAGDEAGDEEEVRGAHGARQRADVDAHGMNHGSEEDDGEKITSDLSKT